MVESPTLRKALVEEAETLLGQQLSRLGFTRLARSKPFRRELGHASELLLFPDIKSQHAHPIINPTLAVENHHLRSVLGELAPKQRYPAFAHFYLRAAIGRVDPWYFSSSEQLASAIREIIVAVETVALPLVSQWATDESAKNVVLASLERKEPTWVIGTPWRPVASSTGNDGDA